MALDSLTACVIVLLAAQAASAAMIEAWAQCGGVSCEGGPCSDAPWENSACATDSTCVRKTQYFWQCLPSTKVFGQCGGKSCKLGGLCADAAWAECPKGSTCIRQSEFYWQCKGDTLVVQSKPEEPTSSVSVSSVSSNSAASSGQPKTAHAKKAQKVAKPTSEPRPLKSLQPQVSATLLP